MPMLDEPDWKIEDVIAYTQGPVPGEKDPNRLSVAKPHNVGRKDFNVDEHGFREDQAGFDSESTVIAHENCQRQS